MFSGEFTYRLDAKGRIPVPPRFRPALKDGVVLSPGIERCITAHTLSEWDKLAASLTGGPITPSKLRRLNRALFATAFTTEMDRQGRIALSAPLREYAGIKDEVVVAGANTYLEIWNRKAWEEEKSISQQAAWQIIESLESRS